MKPKYYFYDSNKDLWIVSRTINGKSEFFCSFKTEEAAQLAVEIFEKSGWHIEDKWIVRAEVREKLGV